MWQDCILCLVLADSRRVVHRAVIPRDIPVFQREGRRPTETVGCKEKG